MAAQVEPDRISLDEYDIIRADCVEWLAGQPGNTFHAVITDPPFGQIEYHEEQLEKRRNGKGGVWRIPPTFDGCKRQPLPRFTVLTDEEQAALASFFAEWAKRLLRTMVPGAHLFIATNPLFTPALYNAVLSAGFEIRGTIIRLVQTLRGGDRPKNAETEFPDVTVMPRGCYEPWGLFRKPTEGKVSDNLKKWAAGALRRNSAEQPFRDVIRSGRTPKEERAIANHPPLKPQEFLRKLCYAALPLGKGVILDPFAGSGSTIAAAVALGYEAVGVELRKEFYRMAKKAIPRLAKLETASDVDLRAVSMLPFS